MSAKQNQTALVVQTLYDEGRDENYREAEVTSAITEGASSRRIEQIVFTQNQRDELRDLGDLAGSLAAEEGMKQRTYVAKTAFTESNGWGVLDDGTTHTVDAAGPEAVITGTVVRRLSPTECERLQGFPDGWTDLPHNSLQARYRQLGNAVAVPVVEWILRRLT